MVCPADVWADDRANGSVAEKRPLQNQIKKKKAPNWSSGPFVILSRRRPTFPHSYPCSIIGPARLNFRVRDGNGCDPRGMTTGKWQRLETRGWRLEENLEPVIRLKLFCSANAMGSRNRQQFQKPGAEAGSFQTSCFQLLISDFKAGDTSSARCRTIAVCYKTLQFGLETTLQ